MTKKINKRLLFYGVVLAVCLTLGLLFAFVPVSNVYAESEPTTGNYDEEFVVTDTADEVLAEYQFVVINDTECSVRITNKTTATKALIPNTAEIDGKEYIVTEVATNGFLAATKLERVKLPINIKKVGGMAFANCTALKRINMANVIEIGNNAFYRCTSLEHIVLPASVETVGSTVFRSNNTAVHIRADAEGENWASNWNTGNGNTTVDYKSQYVEKLELETVYRSVARSAPALTGYALAEGQPRVDKFYEEEGSDIFVPNMYNGDYLLAINNEAFMGAVCDKLVIEYSAKTMFIGSDTFAGVECNDIIINRNITFYDETTGINSENVFAFSTVKRIVLPDTISELPLGAFTYCTDLTNIYFKTPEYEEKREVVLKYADDLSVGSTKGVVYLTQSPTLNTIRESAFMGTSAIEKLHIYDNVKNVEMSIVADWTDTQSVYVHNENVNMAEHNGYNWDSLWNYSVLADDIETHYDAQYYIITFHMDDGTNNTVLKDVKFGEPIGEMPTNDYEYHNLYAWADENSEAWSPESIYNIERDLDLHACYSAYIYVINYESNSPDPYQYPVYGRMSPSYFAYSDNLPLSAVDYRINGWEFDTWRIIVNDVTLDFADGQVINIIDVLTTLGLPTTDGYSITLYAIWTLKNYVIEYDDEMNGYNPNAYKTSYTIQDDTIVFDAPILEGYIGRWEPTSIPQGSYGKQTITAYYVRSDKHFVRLEFNNELGTIINDQFNTSDDYFLTTPSRTNCSFVGWRLKGSSDTFVTNLKGFEEDIVLEAIWVLTGYKYVMPTNATTLTVNESYSTVEIQYVSNAVEIIVTPNVRQLYIYSNSNQIYPVRLTVQSGRNSDFLLVLNNVGMCSTNAEYATITMQDSRSLIITAYNNCVVRGALGASGKRGFFDGMSEIGSDGTAGSQGGIAIDCKYLTICSPITILGGEGGVGGTGYSGRIGGNGGIGGKGNYAIIAQSVTIRSSDITIRGGQGGHGGHGGSGWIPIDNGKGAFGGMGSLAMSTSTLEFELPAIEGIDNCENITIANGASGKKGVNGGKLHEVIM